MENDTIVTTPGRICLFGEHQDYLGLPVIAGAISLRIRIEGRPNDSRSVNIDLPDIGGAESFALDGEISYTKEKDYFRSAVNVLRRNGFAFPDGFDCTVRGDIPINAGTSSSSALVVAWVDFLARMSDRAAVPPPETIARYAYEAEVLEFAEPGGMMDQYTTAIGGVVYIEFVPEARPERLRPHLGAFVLGNSNEPKNTKKILKRVREGVQGIAAAVRAKQPEFELGAVRTEDLGRYTAGLDAGQKRLLDATVRNRDLTRKGLRVLRDRDTDHAALGRLLNEQQDLLRDALEISTPKIDAMIQAALDAGASGGKINGSGGGGCMFAYAPDNPERVADAVGAIGDATIVYIDEGTVADGEEGRG
jgi:galactokinase